MSAEPDDRCRARSPLQLLVVAVALALSCAGAAACSSAATTTSGRADRPDGATAIPPPATPGPPGQLISATRIDGPEHTHAWHLTYHSRSVDDRDIVVTGTLAAPEDPPPDGVPVITWGHPTTGSADECAPSVQQGAAALPVPELLTSRGFAVVATDYEGLGTSDPHPYLVGASEAHAVLDAARAAAQVAGSGVSTASKAFVWGFSQGGHAAAFAGQLAPTYAPELHLAGVVIAAPVSDVEHFARRVEGREDQFGVLVTIVNGFVHAYPELVAADVFTPAVIDQLPELEQRCIGDINILFDRPIAPMLKQKVTERADFRFRFDENQAGRARVDVPVLVIQGGKDDIVDPADTQALVDRWCGMGMAVDYVVKPDANHGVMGDEPATSWTTDRLAGRPAPSTCGTSPGTTPAPGASGSADARSDG